MADTRQLRTRRDVLALAGTALLVIGADKDALAESRTDILVDPGLEIRRNCWWVWRNGRRVRICRYRLSE